jgi:hypothetical protein
VLGAFAAGIGGILATLVVPATASAGTLTPSPSSLGFGNVEVGSSTQSAVTIQNSGTDTTLGTLNLSGPAASEFAIGPECDGQVLADGDSCVVSVTFAPSSIGAKTAFMSVPNDSHAPVIVELSGTGTAPDLTLTPAVFDFGIQAPGTQGAAQSFTVENVGTATASLGGVEIVGSDPSDFAIAAGNCGATLAAGAACEVSVRFSPLSAGAKSALLSVSSEASDSPDQAILTGTAITGPGPRPDHSLQLSVPRRLEAYDRIAVRAKGFSSSPAELWIYVEPSGERCRATPSDRGRDARAIVAGLAVENEIRVKKRWRVKTPGQHRFCGYLAADDGSVYVSSSTARKARPPLLRARRARRTVATALRKHDFASRVIDNLGERCKRRSRSRFSCQFSSAFPGYRLSGRGSVRLGASLSYRFRVTIDDLRVVLTDENEGRFPA